MPRPVFLGLFLGRKPSPRWRSYLVILPRIGRRCRGSKSRGYTRWGWIMPGVWMSRRSLSMGERIWLKEGAR